MSTRNLLRTPLLLTRLEDRTNPASITVKNTDWDPQTPNSLPAAIAEANTTPGQDTILFDYSESGLNTNRPEFTVPAGQTVEVKEGVRIIAGGGQMYAKFTGFRPFEFSHDLQGASGTSLESVIYGGLFDTCVVPFVAGQVGVQGAGGAIQVSGGTLTTMNTRFSNCSAERGGAISVDSGAELIVDASAEWAAPAPPPPPPSPPNVPPAPTPAEYTALWTLFIKNNSAPPDIGAGLGVGGAIWSRGSVVLRRAGFVENTSNTDGGAVAIVGGSLKAEQYMVGETKYDPDVAFLRNTASGAGGAVYFKSTGNSSLTHITVTANVAARGGGFAVLKGTVSLSDSLVSGNQCGPMAGAGIDIRGVSDSPVTVNTTDVKFDSNNGVGGTAVAVYTWGTLNTASCDFSGNNGIVLTQYPIPVGGGMVFPFPPGFNPTPFGIYNPIPGFPDTGLMFVMSVPQ